ncbi:MAG: sugar phosphate isomerase/epimerase family protein [Armatimonadota bacterium]
MYIGATSHVLMDAGLEGSLRGMARVGFTGVELALPHLREIAGSERPEAEAERIGALVAELGMRMPQVHFEVAAMGSLDDARRDADLALVERHMHLCLRMGITVGVLHPEGGMPATLEEYRAVGHRRIDSFARLSELAAQRGFNIAIENTFDAQGDQRSAVGRRRFGSVIPELLEVIDAVGLHNFGICLDTGHTNLQGIPVAEAVRQCGHRLIATHMDDNHGQADEHAEPFRGTVDWPAAVAALREIGYEGIFNLEIAPLRGQPIEAQEAWLHSVLTTARWLGGGGVAP